MTLPARGPLELLKPGTLRLGFGSAAIANLYGPIPEGQALETVWTALEARVTLLDTAPWYGLGLAESRLGVALRGIPRCEYTLSSKVGRVLEGDSARFDFSRDGVLRSLEGSLERLGVDYLDMVHLHDPDDFEVQALDEALPTLLELRDQGVIGAVGAGMNRWEMLSRFAKHGGFDTFLLAGRYTLLEQRALGFLEACHARSIPVLLGGVFNSGILATGAGPGAKYDYGDAPKAVLERVRQLERVCQAYEVPLARAALQFPLAHPAVACVVVGAASSTELEANRTHLNASIPQAFWVALRSSGALDPGVPLPGQNPGTPLLTPNS